MRGVTLPELAAICATVHGHVQGVYFRAFTQQQAVRLGLKGRVRNRYPQGTVEVEAEGTRDQLEAFIRHLQEGPITARVSRVDVRWVSYQGIYPDFNID